MDEARVKQLMGAAGYPESQTIKILIQQVANEVEQGVIARFADPDREEFIEEHRINLDDPVDIREVIQCLTDSNALLDDLQRAYEILPDSHSGNRKMTCDDARATYGMRGVPYDPV